MSRSSAQLAPSRCQGLEADGATSSEVVESETFALTGDALSGHKAGAQGTAIGFATHPISFADPESGREAACTTGMGPRQSGQDRKDLPNHSRGSMPRASWTSRGLSDGQPRFSQVWEGQPACRSRLNDGQVNSYKRRSGERSERGCCELQNRCDRGPRSGGFDSPPPPLPAGMHFFGPALAAWKSARIGLRGLRVDLAGDNTGQSAPWAGGSRPQSSDAEPRFRDLMDFCRRPYE
jgi:hypothetical protein